MTLLDRNKNIVARVQEARSFWQRTRGLMFRSHWDKDLTLWIHRCNSIHTGFMRFPIDAVFVNRKLVVKKIVKNMKPWNLVLPVWSASSVFEFVAGAGKTDGLEVGDQLYVGD